MRLAQQIAHVCAKILFNKERHEYDQCHQLFDETLREQFALNRELVLALAAPDLLDLACRFGEIRPAVVLPLVDLLMADADACALEGRADLAVVLHEKSLQFLARLADGGDADLQRVIASKRSQISARLSLS